MGDNGINIGTFNLGRRDAGGEAVLLLSVDSPVGGEVLEAARALPGVKTVKALSF
jgi:D-3-phosphoglycerate dehydrogenase